MPYQVQKGDTIAKVTNLMKTNWKTLRRLNPNAVGQSSRSGHWFLKEGAVIKGEETFESLLRQKEGNANPSSSTVNSTRSEQWRERGQANNASDAAAHARITVGGRDDGGLVAHVDQAHVSVLQCAEKWFELAGQAEDGFDALTFDGPGYQFRTNHE